MGTCQPTHRRRDNAQEPGRVRTEEPTMRTKPPVPEPHLDRTGSPGFADLSQEMIQAVKNPHPVADGLIDLTIAHDRIVAIFDADGVRDEGERAVLQLFERGQAQISQHHRQELAADAFKRNGPTRHVQQLFKEAGSPLVPLSKECAR